jgi:hypothetical protein
MSEDIFRNNDLVARYVHGQRTDSIVVTFASFTDDPTLDRAGFGEDMFRTANVPAIHIISRGNEWYQYDRIEDLFQEVIRTTFGYPRVLSYGSSMGGYAAIRFADLVGANRVLAMSPQYSIDPQKVPWEKRWSENSRIIDFSREKRLHCSSVPVIIYDQFDDDAKHVDLISSEITVERKAVPFIGHPAGTFLNEAGVIRRIPLAMLSDDLSVDDLLQEAKNKRRECHTYILNAARKQPPYRPLMRSALTDMLGRASPNAEACIFVGDALRARGNIHDALALYERAAEICGRPPHLLLPWSEVLASIGEIAQASEIAVEAAERSSHIAYRQHWAAHLLYLKGEHERARLYNQRSIQIDESNQIYRETRINIEQATSR